MFLQFRHERSAERKSETGIELFVNCTEIVKKLIINARKNDVSNKDETEIMLNVKITEIDRYATEH